MSLTDHPHHDIVTGLRDLADYLEAHPELPITSSGLTIVGFPPYSSDDEKRRTEYVRLARCMGHAEKQADGSYFDMVKRFSGDVRYELSAPRDLICERVVVGTETVEEPDPDAVAALPKVAVEREVVEWRCPPSLLAEREAIQA